MGMDGYLESSQRRLLRPGEFEAGDGPLPGRDASRDEARCLCPQSPAGAVEGMCSRLVPVPAQSEGCPDELHRFLCTGRIAEKTCRLVQDIAPTGASIAYIWKVFNTGIAMLETRHYVCDGDGSESVIN